MNRGSDRVSGGGFEQTRRELERWRRGGARGRRIPEGLWKAAVELGRQHGVSKTALRLGLDYYGLKKRVESATKKATCGDGRGAGFVQMPALGLLPAPECVFELEHPRGVRLRIQLSGPARAELLEPLVRALWSPAR